MYVCWDKIQKWEKIVAIVIVYLSIYLLLFVVPVSQWPWQWNYQSHKRHCKLIYQWVTSNILGNTEMQHLPLQITCSAIRTNQHIQPLNLRTINNCLICLPINQKKKKKFYAFVTYLIWVEFSEKKTYAEM